MQCLHPTRTLPEPQRSGGLILDRALPSLFRSLRVTDWSIRANSKTSTAFEAPNADIAELAAKYHALRSRLHADKPIPATPERDALLGGIEARARRKMIQTGSPLEMLASDVKSRERLVAAAPADLSDVYKAR